MRKYFISILFIFCVFGIYSQNYSFEVEDDIAAFTKKNPPGYFIGRVQLIKMPDGFQEIIGYKEVVTKEDTKFLASENKLVGVTQYVNGKEIYLYDMNGDGKINISAPHPILPAWVITDSKYNKKSSKNNIDKYLEDFYKLFNGNENPYTSDKLNKLINKTMQASTDIKNENRDIIYGIFLYYGLQSIKNPLIDFTNLQIVLNTYLTRFNKDLAHPLIFLWMIETFINMGNSEQASELVDNIVDIYPDFIPFQVYFWQLEKDKKIKEQKYKNLKNKYSKHWIVKQI
ncbi:hypothetical protein E4O00_05400 [Treponema sp. OMZ 788]|uniref:hypothetical protein n=1 Tax=Treponema sp. OMZ 788 TaxID=2563664 RepID=UPI0020A31956|nr:hypothetical protein [Treponema sp. OMZ 788]UTC65539.1 hypothetical protein E4O00_05400 [Treponema sp. OMZ 788]